MIDDDFAFFGFDEISWDRLVALLLGERVGAPKDRRGVLIIVADERGHPAATFHTVQGKIDPRALPPTTDLGALCSATEAGACIVLRERAMAGFADYLAEPLDGDEDFAARVMRFVRVVHELGNGNLLRVWPNPLLDLFLPAAPAAAPAADVLLPEDHAVVLGVFERGELWTGAVLRRRGKRFDTLAGPSAMIDWTGPLGGDWRRDLRLIVRGVARELGVVHAGLFMELPTARSIFIERQAGGWALAYAMRNLLVHPLPAFARAALGVNAVLGTVQYAFQAIEEMDPDEVARIAVGFWQGLTDGRGVEGLLGFSPREALAEVVQDKLGRRSAPSPESVDPPRDRDDCASEARRDAGSDPARAAGEPDEVG